MPGDYFWHCLAAMAATFDGGPGVAEENLAVYEEQCLAFPPAKRVLIRDQIAQIVGGLSRLERRLAEHD